MIARLVIAALLTATPALAADQAALLKRGAVLSMRCSTCHEFAAGKPNKVGPNLRGTLGKPAGGVAGFAYSPALLASKTVWTDATLDAWLERPTAVIPGTRMAFVGLPRPEDRAALIVWLKQATK
jgi:cytochrome c